MDSNIKYHCEKCNLYYNYKSFYEKHLISSYHLTGKRKERKDKKDKPERTIHKCKICSYETINIHNYENHILNNHSSIEEKEQKFTYYCKSCNFGVFTESSYKKHLDGKRHNIKIKNININI